MKETDKRKSHISSRSTRIFSNNVRHPVTKGHTVAQLIEALRYKPEDRGFETRWCHWNFSLT